MGARMMQHGGQLLAPVPIKAANYESGIQWGSLGDPKAALAKQEMSRALKLYEFLKAWYQPIKTTEKGEIVWQVCFKKSSPYKDGPAMPKAFEALMANYLRNKGFPGRGTLDRGNGMEILNFEKHNQASHAAAEKEAEEIWKR